jgi:hypothetical protein
MTTHMSIPSILPLVIILSTFGFILSVILIGKSPKAGVCLVAGLILAALILLLRGARGGLFSTPVGLPFAIIPGTFLFILVVIVLAKDPKAGAVLVVGLLGLGLFGTVFAMRVTRQSTAVAWGPQVRQQTGRGAGSAIVDHERGYEGFVNLPSGGARPPAPPSAPAPIWSAGVDTELDADVYPSEFAALRATSAKLGKSIRDLAPDANAVPSVIVFQEAHPYQLIAELRDAIRRALPEVSCNIESESRPSKADELVVTLYRQETAARPAPWTRGETAVSRGPGLVQYVSGEPDVPLVASGELDINLSGPHGKVRIPIRFTQKPWLEDFATFASGRPEQAFIIARSLGTCTSEGEANQQALNDACARLTEAIGHRSGSKLGPSAPPITPTDVLQGGFIVDRFAQSLEGSTAKIWRQALLLDVSGPKLAQLSRVKVGEYRQVRESWARMGLSVVGVVLLIGVIYFFLNMATRGYYEWSLRIASVVLAAVAVISVLMVVN